MIDLALTIDPSHPAFAGHFPFRAIVPGVVLLDESLRAISAHRGTGAEAGPCRIGNAKFLSIVGPGEPVRLEVEPASRAAADGAPGGAADAADDTYRLRLFAGRDDAERLALTGSVTFGPRVLAPDVAP